MKQEKKYLAELHADNYYHIFNRTNNRELLFKNDEDRKLFLSKYVEYLLPCINTIDYCLLGNHFHFLIKVKSIDDIVNWTKNVDLITQTSAQRKLLDTELDSRTTHKVIKSQFTRLFTSYAMKFNKKYNRSGNLFYRPFKRVIVNKESYFTYLIYYIHANPLKHNIQSDFMNYKWSSFKAILSNKSTNVKKNEVIEWFGDSNAFIEFHRQMDVDLSSISHLMIED